MLKGDVLNLLSCLVRHDDWAVSVGYEVVYKEIYYCDLKTRKSIRKASITKNEHFRRLVQRACNNQVKFDYVLLDI